MAQVLDHNFETAAGVFGLLALVVVARFAPNAEVGFVLQVMGSGGAVGLVAAYTRHRDDPDADRWRTVTLFTLLGLGAGVVLVVGDHLSLIP